MKEFDVAVLGAGPAGAEAALTAAACGLAVILFDEEEAAGGQVHRAPMAGIPRSRESSVGDELRRRLAASAVTCAFGHRVWHAGPGFEVMAISPNGSEHVRARTLIVATGATERHCPVPGWTLPGVIGLAAATVLLKAHGVVPGRRTVVAGSGPLLPLVASKIIEAGGEVTCVVDAAQRGDWLARLPAILRSPLLAARGAQWIARLICRGVPILSGHALRRIEGEAAVQRVRVGPVGRDWSARAGSESVFAADAVCIGFGLLPSTDVTRLLRAEHRFDPASGAWVAQADGDGATSVPGLYVCGDAAGVSGAAAAPHAGRLAGLAAAHALGVLPARKQRRRASRERRLARDKAAFGRAMSALAKPAPGAWHWSDRDTIICRCEGVKRVAIEEAVAAGASTLNDVKSATRCGMGGCGGRICAEPAASIIAQLTGWDRSRVGQATGRSPLRPVVLGDVAGDIDYDSLPFPAPAPL